jgi:glycosyltransferase involved in cell wall biosynthesis
MKTPGRKKVSSQQPAKRTVSKKVRSSPKPSPRSKTVVSAAVLASGVATAGSAQVFDAPIAAVTSVRARSTKPLLLWIGDALVPTGFATVTHSVLDHLRQDWDVVVSGVNYDGAPHDLPYRVMPAWQGGDMWGMNRFQALCAEFAPAAVVINNDWWNVAEFVKLAPEGVPVVGYMPVDGGNLDPAAVRELNRLHAAVWYTGFGHREAVKAGFRGKRHVIPHGIDTGVFQPMNRVEARQLLDLNVPRSAFIAGNLNRNQPRKRLDLTIEIFADWVRSHAVTDAFLLLHCARKDTGWDLHRVAEYHGVADRLLLTGSEGIRDLQATHHLQFIYNSLDVQMSTTLGEGWGLTTMEGMACGIPQIVPDSSALAEWAEPAVKIPCSRMLMNPEINTTGALVDHAPFVAALDALYRNKVARAELAARSVQHVRQDGFTWNSIARQFNAVLKTLRSKGARLTSARRARA